MRRTSAMRRAGLDLHVVAVLACLAVISPVAGAAAPPGGTRGDTLWIFDADFSDLVGDNAGWTSVDLSGTLGVENYWHRDTLRPCPRPESGPGEWSWWCGTYDPCWAQPRGYGNNWYCCLVRDLALSEWSTADDLVTLEWDQRYAMERNYDYGYVEVSDDGGLSWSTLTAFCNPGFTGAGTPIDWDSVTNGHRTIYLSTYAGTDVSVRFRFESDAAYSAQDQTDNIHHSVKDGAWQVDNLAVRVNESVSWFDDCESPGDNGWEHTDIPASGQTGVTFFRGQLGVDFSTGRPPYSGQPADGTWMFAAVGGASRMVDGQNSRLVSPPIDIADALVLVGEFECWVDFPDDANDAWELRLASGNVPECIDFHSFNPNPLPMGPEWTTIADDWSNFAGNDWLKVAWATFGDEPEPGGHHMAGLFLNRVRVGIPLDTGVPDDVAAQRALSIRPNPFNPSATIEYTLDTRAHATIRVVDASGRIVATLLDAEVGPGSDQMTWDGTTDAGGRVASGVYFVLLESDGVTATRKAVLLK